jgi:hypothetical protein
MDTDPTLVQELLQQKNEVVGTLNHTGPDIIRTRSCQNRSSFQRSMVLCEQNGNHPLIRTDIQQAVRREVRIIPAGDIIAAVTTISQTVIRTRNINVTSIKVIKQFGKKMATTDIYVLPQDPIVLHLIRREARATTPHTFHQRFHQLRSLEQTSRLR